MTSLQSVFGSIFREDIEPEYHSRTDCGYVSGSLFILSRSFGSSMMTTDPPSPRTPPSTDAMIRNPPLSFSNRPFSFWSPESWNLEPQRDWYHCEAIRFRHRRESLFASVKPNDAAKNFSCGAFSHRHAGNATETRELFSILGGTLIMRRRISRLDNACKYSQSILMCQFFWNGTPGCNAGQDCSRKNSKLSSQYSASACNSIARIASSATRNALSDVYWLGGLFPVALGMNPDYHSGRTGSPLSLKSPHLSMGCLCAIPAAVFCGVLKSIRSEERR